MAETEKQKTAKRKACTNCSKQVKRITWFYKNGKYFCSKGCAATYLKKAQEEKKQKKEQARLEEEKKKAEQAKQQEARPEEVKEEAKAQPEAGQEQK
jgi:endogenous inhibitor of DNA gyrase (YacG/DUF329 family)